jgi:hypothetical protein
MIREVSFPYLDHRIAAASAQVPTDKLVSVLVDVLSAKTFSAVNASSIGPAGILSMLKRAIRLESY